jgi:hypothetical protein
MTRRRRPPFRAYRVPWLRPFFLAWWRLRERDVLDARSTTGSGKSAPDYTYGKVTGLEPDLLVMTETSESPYVCCGYASAGMAVRTVKPGLADLLAKTAHPIRAQGGRPHDNGSRASELRAGASSAHGVKLEALARDEIPGRLRDGFGVVINLDYADLPGWLKVQGGSFGHSVALFGWREADDCVGFFDPLWPQDARGAWAPWSSIKPALWADGEHSGTVKRYAAPPPEPGPEPPPEPPPAPCYSELELRAAEARAAELAVVMAGDAAVGAWLEWLRAPRPGPADAWDVGAWADQASELDELLEDGAEADPCAPGASASWSRGGILAPVADALAAYLVPAAWDVSAWRAGAWRA